MAKRAPQHRRPAVSVAPARPAPEAKVNPAYASLISFSDIPQPVTMPRNYRNFAREGYGGNGTIYKCVQYIMSNGGAIPPKLYTDRTRETEIPKHPLLDLLDRPNPEQTGVEYREAVIGFFLIAANSYQYAIRNKPSGPPAELWTLEPDKVSILPSKTRGIVGYKYDDFEQQIDPLNIGRMRSWNPNNPLYGMSPIEVGAILVDQQTAANKWNLALLQNFARPPGAWVVPTVLDKNARAELEAKINGKFTGYSNAGKMPVLDAGATWQAMAVPPADMDWLKAIQYNAAMLANLYNIAPQLIGDTSSTTYNNMEQAKAASYTEAIFPILDKLYALWNNWLLPMYPDLQKAYLYYDKDSVEVVQNLIQAQKSAEAERAVKAYLAGACTLNQALVMQGLPDVPEGGVYRIGAVLVPADKLTEYADQSMTMPAAPPKQEPEPIAVLPPAAPEPAAPSPAEPPKPEPPEPAPEPAAPLPAKSAPPRLRIVPRRKALGTVTHLLWECDADACDWCLQNDGALIADGDSFPNGCTGPDDSHRYCKCTVRQLAIPDDADTAHLDMTALIAFFLVNTLGSRHAADVAARARQLAEQQAEADAEVFGDADEEDSEDAEDVQYAKAQQRRQRRARREDFHAREVMPT